MSKYLALVTASILWILSAQAEPIFAVVGYAWSALHIFAAFKIWHEN